MNGSATLANALTFLFIAVAYNTWGFLGKSFGVTAGWMAFLVFVGTLFGSVFWSLTELTQPPKPSLVATMALLGAGILNGIAVSLASAKMVDPLVPSAITLMVILVLMVVLMPFFGWAFHGQLLSGQQWIGVVLAGFAIYMLVG